MEIKKHRSVVGGLWDELGSFQLKMLTSEGLQASHTLLDIGCGSLRGGLHVIPYLTNGIYIGLDTNQSLLDAGKMELENSGFIQYDNYQLYAVSNFRLPAECSCKDFDFILAFSLFTHLPEEQLKLCFEGVAEYLSKTGKFVATFFLADKTKVSRAKNHDRGTIITYPDRDPFHYSIESIQAIADRARLTLRIGSEYHHPRGQTVIVFERKSA
jgi:cyclopropane fatty-acyl-phospholipid synthase-like methyltransferase